VVPSSSNQLQTNEHSGSNTLDNRHFQQSTNSNIQNKVVQKDNGETTPDLVAGKNNILVDKNKKNGKTVIHLNLKEQDMVQTPQNNTHNPS
jgi:hypothetical protein